MYKTVLYPKSAIYLGKLHCLKFAPFYHDVFDHFKY